MFGDRPRTRILIESSAESEWVARCLEALGRVVTEYEREGKAVAEQSRYTDTYVLRDGPRQVVASHLSNVEQAKRPGPEK